MAGEDILNIIGSAALANKCSRKDFKEEWDAFRFLIDDKMFAMLGEDKSGRSILTVKLDPQYGEILRQSYPDKVVPGYYMNKTHWNSFYLENHVDSNIISDAIVQSYNLILHSLSKKRQAEIEKTE